MARLIKQTRFIAFLAFAMLATAMATAPVQAQQPVRAKVVVQMSEADPAKWNLALNNVRNLQADLGAANVDIELVAYGPGIGMLKADSVVGTRIDEALGAGVKVLACENTMRGAKLTPADMLGKVGYVPAGVVEITQRQMQGWAYLRP
jgi:intracellular sulfur oxidation DsrE/DsrF family protein